MGGIYCKNRVNCDFDKLMTAYRLIILKSFNQFNITLYVNDISYDLYSLIMNVCLTRNFKGHEQP